MDRPETLAYEYLKTLGFSPKFEPLGYKTFPDFEVDNSIGVEVRRLNENYFEDDSQTGLEEKSYPLYDAVDDVLSKYKAANCRQNFWVHLTLKRPFPRIKEIKESLESILNELFLKDRIEPERIQIAENVSIRISEKSSVEPQVLHVGSTLDFDSGGYVIPNLLQNLNYCIYQKTKKAENSDHGYNELWLILIDEISYGLNDSEKEYVVQNTEKPTAWSKIITLNTLNGSKIIEF